jgi:hypothetical protein
MFMFASLRRSALLAATAAIGVVTAGVAAQAANLVQNGGFETTSAVQSTQINLPPPVTIANWTAGLGSYTFIFVPGDPSANSIFGPNSISLYSPAGPDTLSGGGGNFIADDPAFDNGSLDQTITGLIVGASYTLTFDYAGAQESGFSGDTLAGWQVSLGSQTQFTGGNPDGDLFVPNHGFVDWTSAIMDFTATSSSEVLSFLSTGGPLASQPPFALLDNVSLTQNNVPEPMTLSVFGVGLVGAAAWRRRKASKKA